MSDDSCFFLNDVHWLSLEAGYLPAQPTAAFHWAPDQFKRIASPLHCCNVEDGSRNNISTVSLSLRNEHRHCPLLEMLIETLSRREWRRGLSAYGNSDLFIFVGYSSPLNLPVKPTRVAYIDLHMYM